MMAEENIQIPLFETFLELMQLEKDQPHKSVEPDSYLLLIDRLRKGYMLNSRDELLFFCKKLWLKPFHLNSSVINEKVLETVLFKNLDMYAKPEEKADTTPSAKDKKSDTKKESNKKQREDDTPVENDLPAPGQEEEPIKAAAPQIAEKISLVLSIEETASGNRIASQDYSTLFNDKNYRFNYEYLPVSRRFIEQTVRSLRYRLKGIGRPLIDIEATVKDTATKGYFENWTVREEDGFVTRWTLLMDQEGSMIAFHSLQEAIIEAALNGTIKNEGDVFYFRNVVTGFLYTNSFRTRSVPISELASGPGRNILIVSDAGAARGYRNLDRVQDTYTMLYELRKHRIAWLNPLPRERWSNTSAEDISSFVSMFETGDDYADNLGNIVQLFKSKLVPRLSNQAW